MRNDRIDRAVKTISSYCAKTVCEKCRYANEDGDCIIYRAGPPCDWILDIEKNRKGGNT